MDFEKILKLVFFPLILHYRIAVFFVDLLGLRPILWNVFVYILTNWRSVLVVAFVMPLSFVFDGFWRLRTWYIARFKSAPAMHKERVKKIQDRVLQWNQEGRGKVQMCTARPGWMTVSPRHATYKNVLFTVNIDLTDILKLDEEKQVLHVEPSVNILQILDYLLPKGYTLPIIPELDELTIGGLVSGYGIETSSHKYGLFNDICVAFELVLADGRIMRVTKEDKLFHAIPWSFGTIAFLTAVEIKVIHAAKFVRHQYIPCRGKEEFVNRWTEIQTRQEPPEFLEGIMYDENSGVIMTGDFTDYVKPGDTVNNINWWFKPYFYIHAQRSLHKGKEFEELIPIRQYYQRHNRSLFWALQDQVPICHNTIFRFLFGWLLPPRVPFLKLIESDAVTKFYEENYVMQDWLVPLDKMLGIIAICNKELAVYPLWLCPHRLYHTGKYQGKTRAPPGTRKEGDFVHYVDAATIGPPAIKNFNTVQAIRTVEAFLRSVGGYQGSYSYTYQTREEFRQMFDHSLYDEVRKETKGDEAFPESYDKISRKNQWKKD